MHRFFFILLFLFNFFYLQGQTKFGFEVGSKLGVLSPHRPVIRHLPRELVKGGELSFFKVVAGNKEWHNIYKLPKIGLTLYYSNLGNDDVLGNALGMTSWIQFRFIQKQHHHFGLNLRLGIGHISKPFDLNLNPQNIAISSHWNCLAIGGIQYQYVWDKLSIGTRLDLTHFSNAAFIAPNLGLNIIQSSIALNYLFSKNKLQLNLTKTPINTEHVINKNSLLILGFIGQKQIFNHLGQNFKIQGGTLAYQHLFSLPVGIEIGFDIMKNASDIKILEDKGLIVNSVFKSGAYLGYVLTFDKLHFIVAMGHYLRDQFNLNDKLYHRIGLRYIFLNKFLINCTLKSHWGNADYLEFGLGLRFG